MFLGQLLHHFIVQVTWRIQKQSWMFQEEYRKGIHPPYLLRTSPPPPLTLPLSGYVFASMKFDCSDSGLCSIGEIPELFVVGKPDMTIVAFGSDVLDIFEVNDIMSSRGWHLNALQRPNRSCLIHAILL